MRVKDLKKPAFYDVQHYINLKNFTLQGNKEAKKGMRSMKLSSPAVFIMLSIYTALSVLLGIYLFNQAVTTAAAADPKGEMPEGIPTLFLTSVGGAMIALPLVALTLWLLRNIFVQPILSYLMMFIHGATFAVYASLLASGYAPLIYQSAIEHTQTQSLSFFATVHAPIAEELFKGLGIVFMLLAFKNFIRTPHDGAIYGMLLGFGFAFTENIQYFIQYGGSNENFWLLLISRVFASILTHATFTAAIGLMAGYFYSRYGTFGRAMQGWGIGFIIAASLHALWNGSSSVGMFLPVYLLLFLPLFIGVSSMMKKSAKFYDNEYLKVLDEYKDAGWFPYIDYNNLFPKQQRKAYFRRMTAREKKEARHLASTLSELVYIRLSLRKAKNNEPFIQREREILLGLTLHQEVVRSKDHENPNNQQR